MFVDAADVEVFEKNFAASMKGTLTGVAGLTKARLLAPRTDERGYLSILEFVDRQAYQDFLGSEAFAAAHNWPDHAPFHSNQLAEFEPLLEL